MTVRQLDEQKKKRIGEEHAGMGSKSTEGNNWTDQQEQLMLVNLSSTNLKL